MIESIKDLPQKQTRPPSHIHTHGQSRLTNSHNLCLWIGEEKEGKNLFYLQPNAPV